MKKKWKHCVKCTKCVNLFKTLSLICFFFLLGMQVNAAHDSYSQSTLISLDLNNKTLKEAFLEIERNTKFVFFYQDDVLDNTKKVNMNVKEVNIEKILDLLLASTGNTYKIDGYQLYIYKKSEESSFSTPQNSKKGSKLIKGKVVDDLGEPLPGVNIVIAGSTRGVSTDLDGSFQIDAPANGKLIFSFIGFQSMTVEVMKLAELITMKPIANELDAVTVVAFGKQKKESVMAAITTVNTKDLKIPSSNLTTAFAGRIAGMISYQRSGEPGKDDASYFVRGVTTFGTGKADPLVLIDGVEVSSIALSHLTPDDIGSFSIMKDATATALYGARGANGVILVTTKEGVEGKTKLSFRAEMSISQPTSMVDIADPITYMKLYNEAVRVRTPLSSLPYSLERIDVTEKGTEPLLYPQVDWYDMMFKNNTINDRYNLNISGGGKLARYYVAASYNKDRGILKNDPVNNFNNNVKVDRYTLRTNVNMNFTPTTEAYFRLNADMGKTTGPLEGGAYYFNRARNASPVDFPAFYSKDGNTQYLNHILFGSDLSMKMINPYADMVKGYGETSSSDLLAQIGLTQKLNFITEGLSVRGMFNLNRYSSSSFSRSTTPFLYMMTKNLSTGENMLTNLNPKEGKSYLVYSNGASVQTSSMYGEFALQYGRTFGEKHDVGGVLVFTFRDAQNGNAGNLISSLPFRNLTYAGRFTYAYDTRYFVEANFGYWGSERFEKNNRWGFFPSAGLGWMISNEEFMSGTKDILTKLKLKATYGLTGNDQIGDVNDRFFYISNVNMDAGGVSFGTKLEYYQSGISFNRYADPDITWEVARKFNLGLELGLFNNLEIQFDYFTETRDNILQRRASIPCTMGLQVIPSSNIGQAKASGIEVSLDYNKYFNKDMWLTVRGNFTYASSKYTKFEEPQYTEQGLPWKSYINRAISQPEGLIAERLFIDDEDVRNSPEQTFGEYGPGDIKYKDINGDGKITNLDLIPIGLPTTPEIIYGFGFSYGYKSFDFSCFFQGSARSSFFIDPEATSPFAGGQRAVLKEYADDHWSIENQNPYALWPCLSPVVQKNNIQTSTWWMRNGSFLRMKSAEIGYNVPVALSEKVKLANLRLYVSGSNLFVLSDFKMWDIEMAGNGLGYPVQRVYNVGVKIDF